MIVTLSSCRWQVLNAELRGAVFRVGPRSVCPRHVIQLPALPGHLNAWYHDCTPLNVSHWARPRPLPQCGLDLVETGPWLSQTSRMLVSPKFTADVAISLLLWESGQPRLDSGSSPAGWFPLPDAVAEAFGLPPICPSIVRLRCPLSSLASRWTVVRVDMR